MKHTCRYCSYFSIKRGNVDRHTSAVHKDIREELTCPICNKHFSTKKKFSTHYDSCKACREHTFVIAPFEEKRFFYKDEPHLFRIYEGLRNISPPKREEDCYAFAEKAFQWMYKSTDTLHHSIVIPSPRKKDCFVLQPSGEWKLADKRTMIQQQTVSLVQNLSTLLYEIEKMGGRKYTTWIETFGKTISIYSRRFRKMGRVVQGILQEYSKSYLVDKEFVPLRCSTMENPLCNIEDLIARRKKIEHKNTFGFC